MARTPSTGDHPNGMQIVNKEGWNADQWMPLPGGRQQHRVRFWIAVNPDERTFRLDADPYSGQIVGLEVLHLRDDGVWCGGYVTTGTDVSRAFVPKQSGHTLEAIEPLHLEASLGCKNCPSHGFVRDGTWIDC